MSKRVTIDPITRIEGHLRIDVDVDGGHVAKAWSSGQMWRGVELILLGRDPRDAWAITQRICGVCTTVHAITSVRAVENALQMEVPLNAQYIRNMIILAHSIHDFIVHFYHLSALDWVDVTSALKADPDKTASLAEGLSSWNRNGRAEMRAVKERLAGFVGGGQLGIFTNGYWGHPAMKLPPEVNLLAVAHYLQALEIQRHANKIVTILGSKSPHIQNVAVGGVSNPLATDSQSVLTVERLLAVKEHIDALQDFVKNVYLVDVAAIGAFYADWTKYGAGVTNYLSVPDIPLDTKGTQFAFPGGYIPNKDLAQYKPIKSFNDGRRRGRQALLVRLQRGQAATPVQGRDQAELHRLPGRRQVFLAEVADLLRQAGASGPPGAGAQHVGGRLRARQDLRHQDAGYGIGAGQDQSRPGCDALDHRPPRGTHDLLLHQRRPAGRAVEPAPRQHGQGRSQDLQQARVPEGRSHGRRLSRGAARCAVALGGDRRRQDQELPVRRAVDLECLSAQRQG